jgi:PTS system nitrogen regulatory IIA component
MNIAEILPRQAVLPDLRAANRDAVLAELLDPLQTLHPELRAFDLLDALCAREKLGSTAVGEGVAIPHGKVPGLGMVLLAVGRSRKGIDFAASDGEPCYLFFLILAPEYGAGQHLRLLAQIARRAKDPLFRSEMLLAETSEQLWQTITAP